MKCIFNGYDPMLAILEIFVIISIKKLLLYINGDYKKYSDI